MDMASKNLKRLFRKFDELGYKLSQMNFTHPDYEEVSDDYDIMEDELEELGYEIPSGINPFKVDSGKIKDIETGKVVHVRESKMKITKMQLRRIIKEEKAKLQEARYPLGHTAMMDALDEFVDSLDEQMGYGVPNATLKAEVLKLVDEYFAKQEALGQ